MAQKGDDKEENEGTNLVSDISHTREGCKKSADPGSKVIVYCSPGIECVTAEDNILKCRCANPGKSGSDLKVSSESLVVA